MISTYRRAAMALAFSLVALPAFAASKCYEQKFVPATFGCDSSKSRSADFSVGCTAVPAHYDNVEVECKGTWVNVTSSKSDQSHSEVCATAGLKKSNIDGQLCASGERKAQGGTGTVTYKFGKTGADEPGGDVIDKYTYKLRDPGGDSTTWGAGTQTYYFCYGKGQKRDMDNTDLVAAYACK